MGFGRIKDISRKRLLTGCCMLAFFLTIIWLSPQILFLNFSDSIPRGLYLRIPVGTTVKVGDIVVYMPTDDVVVMMRSLGWLEDGQPPKPFLKYVGAISGDIFSVCGHSFSINGDYVGDVLNTDSKGQVLPRINGSFLVSDFEFLPISSNAHGFDGRYTGCVPINRIISKAIFLFGW